MRIASLRPVVMTIYLVCILIGYNYFDGRRQEQLSRSQRKCEGLGIVKFNCCRCLSDAALNYPIAVYCRNWCRASILLNALKYRTSNFRWVKQQNDRLISRPSWESRHLPRYNNTGIHSSTMTWGLAHSRCLFLCRFGI